MDLNTLDEPKGIPLSNTLLRGLLLVALTALSLISIGCGSEDNSAALGTSSYAAAGPVSARSETATSSSSPDFDELSIRPAMVRDPLGASVTYSSPATRSSIVAMGVDAYVFYRGSFARFTGLLTPPISSTGLFDSSGRYRINSNTRLTGSATDDGVTLTLGGESFSGVPSGPNVTYTDNPNPQWRESYLLPDGSFVSKFLGTSTVAADTNFFRELSIDIPSSGLVILNATASPFDLAAGQNATLNFDLVPIGSPRPPINQWIVSVVQPNNTTNQPFYTFPALAGSQGPGTTSPVANGLRVNVPWDGRNDTGQVVSGDFSWIVTPLCQGSVRQTRLSL